MIKSRAFEIFLRRQPPEQRRLVAPRRPTHHRLPHRRLPNPGHALVQRLERSQRHSPSREPRQRRRPHPPLPRPHLRALHLPSRPHRRLVSHDPQTARRLAFGMCAAGGTSHYPASLHAMCPPQHPGPADHRRCRTVQRCRIVGGDRQYGGEQARRRARSAAAGPSRRVMDGAPVAPVPSGAAVAIPSRPARQPSGHAGRPARCARRRRVGRRHATAGRRTGRRARRRRTPASARPAGRPTPR